MISQCLWLMSQLINPRKLRRVKKWREITFLPAAFLGTIWRFSDAMCFTAMGMVT